MERHLDENQLKEAYGASAFDWVYWQYRAKFPTNTYDSFIADFAEYADIPCFKANENIYEISTDYSDREELDDAEDRFIKSSKKLSAGVHWIMRSLTQYYLSLAFDAMKIDQDDPNIRQNALGKGTPGRIAKMWCGNDPEDTTELGSGRWNSEPFISYFPNEEGANADIITKEVDVVSCCSHHFLPFSTFNGGKAFIAYKPGKYVLGISKLQRFVNWASKRFWLQEDLTTYIGKIICRVAATDDVYVRLEHLAHGCEKFRGVSSRDGSLTTEFKSGIFKSTSINLKNR